MVLGLITRINYDRRIFMICSFLFNYILWLKNTENSNCLHFQLALTQIHSLRREWVALNRANESHFPVFSHCEKWNRAIFAHTFHKMKVKNWILRYETKFSYQTNLYFLFHFLFMKPAFLMAFCRIRAWKSLYFRREKIRIFPSRRLTNRKFCSIENSFINFVFVQTFVSLMHQFTDAVVEICYLSMVLAGCYS